MEAFERKRDSFGSLRCPGALIGGVWFESFNEEEVYRENPQAGFEVLLFWGSVGGDELTGIRAVPPASGRRRDADGCADACGACDVVDAAGILGARGCGAGIR